MGMETKKLVDKQLTILTKSKHSPLDLAHVRHEAEEHYVSLRGLGIIVVAEDCGKDSWGLFLRSVIETGEGKKQP